MLKEDLKREIINNLIYGEIFKHPLNCDELSKYSSCNVDDLSESFDDVLNELVNEELIKHEDGLYFIFNDNDKVSRRKEGSENANKLMPKALKVAKFIYKFPYVKGVGISGSMSKGVLFDDGDIDFFIITKSGRLWVARTLLILYKKLILRNSREYFCVNYFVDTNNLEIQEKNKFTAMEIMTLIPAEGSYFNDFMSDNKWVKAFHYQFDTHKKDIKNTPKPLWSIVLTKILDTRLGEWVDELFMKITLKRWKQKFGSFDEGKFELAMKTRKYVSKHHPNDFQSKVLSKYDTISKEYKEQNAEKLNEANIAL